MENIVVSSLVDNFMTSQTTQSMQNVLGLGGYLSDSSSFETRITNQEDFSSSLNATFATNAELSSISSSIVSTITIDSSSFETRITNQESFSSSLNDTYATDDKLSSVSSSIVSTITTDSASFSTRINVLEGDNYISSSGQDVVLGIVTASSANVSGDLVVGGTITAQQFNTEFVSSSIIYESGSTKFGDTSDDTHQFTGSVDIKGGIEVSGSIVASQDIIATDNLIASGSIFGLNGVVLVSPNDTQWKITVDNSGSLITTDVGTVSYDGSGSITFEGETVTFYNN